MMCDDMQGWAVCVGGGWLLTGKVLQHSIAVGRRKTPGR